MGDFNALLISYAFPPVGGAGVQRTAKLVKFLHEFGISPSVLTVSNPSVPLRDEALMGDIPPGTRIVRAATLEPSYGAKQATWKSEAVENVGLYQRGRRLVMSAARKALVPDPQVLWLPGAAMALGKELRTQSVNCVLVSAPPFSQFLLAPIVRASRHTGVVVDYRDEWSTARNTYEMLTGSLARITGESLEHVVLRVAHFVTTATEDFREHLLAHYKFLRPERVVAIPNGYDPDDFAIDSDGLPNDRLVLTYAGTVFKLTSAVGLLAAIRLVHERDPQLAKSLTVRFIGRIGDTEQQHFEGFEKMGVEQVGYVPHDRVIGELSRSHVTLCLLDDVPGVERIYPAKIFELMYLSQPVLALTPEGALSRLVRAHSLGVVIAPRDVERIAEQLSHWLVDFRSGTVPGRHGHDSTSIGKYHRRVLAGQFAVVMRRAASLTVHPN